MSELGALTTIDVHARDAVQTMVNAQISSPNDLDSPASFIPIYSINGPDIGSLNNLFFGEDIGMVEEIYGKEVMEQCIADKAIVDMIVEITHLCFFYYNIHCSFY